MVFIIKKMDTNTVFNKHQVNPGNSKQIDLAGISLNVIRQKEGWKLETGSKNSDETPASSQKSGFEYFHTGKSNSLVIAPALPAKPLVFKATKLTVLPGQKLTFFIKIPLVFQVYFAKVQPENLLKEVEYRRLSDTWFGEPDNGELAFSIGSEFFLDFDETATSEFEAICPVAVTNNSATSLDVQRLILRVENMNLYKNGNRNVTSIVEIEYRGSDVVSSVEYQHSRHFHGDKQEIIAKPRNVTGKNLLKINFHFIKNIYKSE